MLLNNFCHRQPVFWDLYSFLRPDNIFLSTFLQPESQGRDGRQEAQLRHDVLLVRVTGLFFPILSLLSTLSQVYSICSEDVFLHHERHPELETCPLILNRALMSQGAASLSTIPHSTQKRKKGSKPSHHFSRFGSLLEK